MLNPWEKPSLRRLISLLSEENLQVLFEVVTDRAIGLQLSHEATVETILAWSQSAVELLSRKKICKPLLKLFIYLETGVVNRANRTCLIDAVLQYLQTLQAVMPPAVSRNDVIALALPPAVFNWEGELTELLESLRHSDTHSLLSPRTTLMPVVISREGQEAWNVVRGEGPIVQHLRGMGNFRPTDVISIARAPRDADFSIRGHVDTSGPALFELQGRGVEGLIVDAQIAVRAIV